MLLAGQTIAETRFMQVSTETIAGRRMETIDGTIYNFHRDGRLTGRSDRARKLNGSWSVGYGVVTITWKNGRSLTFQTYKVDSEQFAIFTHGRQNPHRSKITSVTALD